jgi:hypothetical protein
MDEKREFDHSLRKWPRHTALGEMLQHDVRWISTVDG